MPIKQSICYPLLKPAAPDPASFCALAAECGYAGIDLWGAQDIEPLAPHAARHHLTLTGFVAGGPAGGPNDPAWHEAGLAAMRDSLELAARHGIPTIIAFTGNRIPGQGDLEALSHSTNFFRRLAPSAEKAGVTVCVEMLNSRIDHPHYLGDSSAFGFALCRLIDHPRIKVLHDLYHLQIMEGDLIRNLLAGAQWIGHVHTAGVPGRVEPDDRQEIHYPAVFQALAETGYDGFVGHEYKPTGDAARSMRQVASLYR